MQFAFLCSVAEVVCSTAHCLFGLLEVSSANQAVPACETVFFLFLLFFMKSGLIAQLKPISFIFVGFTPNCKN